MSVFASVSQMGHEQVLFCSDPSSGLRAIIAVHSTALGPALGGCRLWPYASEQEALTDVLRLSRGMTYKAAIAGLDLGGGKSVILADPSQKSEALWRAFGRQVASLGGRYLVAEDMNTTPADVAMISRECAHVTGLPASHGGIGAPGPITAHGVFVGLRAAVAHGLGSSDLKGLRVGVQGLGSVGFNLCRELHEAGASLVVTDLSAERVAQAVEAFGATAVASDAYVGAEVDVLAPCAVGAVLSAQNLEQVKAKVVAGGANNILVDDVADAEAFREAGILVAPDYVLNAGGLIAMDVERRGGSRERAMHEAEAIEQTTGQLLTLADEKGWTPMAASRYMAEARIESVRRVQRMRFPG